MFKVLASLGFAATALASTETMSLGLTAEDHVLNLGLPNDPAVEKAFEQIYNSALKDFDIDTYKMLMEDLETGLKNYKHSNAYTAYKSVPAQPVCDRGVISPAAGAALNTKAVTPFPGGMLKRLFGFDLGKLVFELSQKAAGPAAASGGMAPILAMQALSMG